MVDEIPRLGREPRDPGDLNVFSRSLTLFSGGRGVRHHLYPPPFPKDFRLEAPDKTNLKMVAVVSSGSWDLILQGQ